MKRHGVNAQIRNQGHALNRYQQGGRLPTFQGAQIQRGFGIGSLFGSLARTFMPLFKRGAKAVSKAAVKTGMNVAKDVMSGRDFRTSVKARAGETRKELMNSAVNSIQSRFGSQSGKGLKRKASPTGNLYTQAKRSRTTKGNSKNPKRKPSTKASGKKSAKKQQKRKAPAKQIQDIFGI